MAVAALTGLLTKPSAKYWTRLFARAQKCYAHGAELDAPSPSTAGLREDIYTLRHQNVPQRSMYRWKTIPVMLYGMFDSISVFLAECPVAEISPLLLT